MKRITTLGILLIAVILGGVASASAQDFNALLEAVEKIESNLKQLVEQEAEARTQEMAKLRLELMAVKGQASAGDQSPQLAELAQAVKLLSEQVKALQSQERSVASGQTDEIAGLIAEMELLRNELQSLKTHGGSETGPKLASTNNEAAMQIAFGEGAPEAETSFLDGRSRLEEKGVTFELVYTGELVSNTAGGLSQRSEYLENGDVMLSIDAEKLMNWKGASFSFYALGDRGGSASELVGDVQGVSNIESDDTWKLYEAWYQQNFAQDRLSLLFGLYDLNSEFDVTENAGLFLNSSFGIGPDYSQSGQNGPSIFPTTSMAIRARYQPSDAFYIQSAVFDGVPGDPDDPSGTQIQLGGNDGVLIATEVAYLTGTGEDSETPYSKFALGGWFYSAEFDDISEVDNLGEPIKRSGNKGLYIIGEQTVYREQDQSQGLALFARVGFANTSINQIGSYFGGGLVYSGLIPGRDEDQIGLAIAAAVNGNKFEQAMSDLGTPVESAEIVLELSYKLQVLPQLAIQPDLQYVINPSTDPNVKNALLLGTRFELSF